MENAAGASGTGRRERTGGIVREKLDILMDSLRRERVPAHLIELAEELQSALDQKAAAEKDV